MDRNELLQLYAIQSEALGRYNSIIWQFPTALIVSSAAIVSLSGNPIILGLLALANYLFVLLVYRRHVNNHRALVKHVGLIEDQVFDDSISLPKPNWQTYWLKSTLVVLWFMLLLNTALLAYSAILISGNIGI